MLPFTAEKNTWEGWVFGGGVSGIPKHLKEIVCYCWGGKSQVSDNATCHQHNISYFVFWLGARPVARRLSIIA
jgi:hypothetical protein